MIDIKILNSEKELASFPITQSLRLSSDTEVDTTLLSDHIILFRTVPEKGLISLVEPYSYTAGYIKEKFTTVALEFKQTKEDELFNITVIPKETLFLDSQYILYITKNLLAANTVVSKLVSKSASSALKVFVKPPVVVTQTIKVLVTSTSKLTTGSNLVSFKIGNDPEFSINLKENKSVTISNVQYEFTDTVYVQGEEFSVSVTPNTSSLVEDILYKFTTAPSESIQPIKNQNSSQTINTQDILNFYSKVEKIKESSTLVPKYIAPNLFSITIPEGYTLDTNKDILLSVREAFSNYLLRDLELYEQTLKYSIYVYQEDSELYVEVVYNDDELAESIQVLSDEDEPLLHKVKRGGL